MRLTQHFTLEELTASQTAARRGIDNTPSEEIVERLRNTAAHMELVRALLGGHVVSVSSGYRGKRLNKVIGGSKTSAHMDGDAVDFNVYGFGPPLEVCREIADSRLVFDQLIFENTWTHISFAPACRRQVLTYQHGRYTAGLPA